MVCLTRSFVRSTACHTYVFTHRITHSENIKWELKYIIKGKEIPTLKRHLRAIKIIMFSSRQKAKDHS